MAITLAQVQHASRYLSQVLKPVRVGVIGGYHGVNLGDIALGTSVTNILKSKKISTGLQTIYNLEKWKWPKSPYAIVGGGAVGYSDSLLQISKRYKSLYKNIGLLGVDFNEKNYSVEIIEFLKQTAWLSCRSQIQAKFLKEITNRLDITVHPDLAFSLIPHYCLEQRENVIKAKKMMVNIVPLYSKIIDGKFHPLAQYKTERPELYQSFNIMQECYKSALRSQVIKAIENGYEVETIPFTPADEIASKIILEGLKVEHAAYHSNPIKMIKKMANAERIIATRYHATIFALKLGANLTPIAYALKNESLLQELGFSRNSFLSAEDIAKGNLNFPDPIQCKSDIISKWENQSVSAINSCINSLNIH
ncbi:hypothetical protein GCM10028808_45740 [Spirosoma migulaei]